MKHTPGPWRVIAGKEPHTFNVVTAKNDGNDTCVVRRVLRKANADFIADAPAPRRRERDASGAMSYFDEEAIESERFYADMEMAEIEAAGRSSAKRIKLSAALRAQGKLAQAAAVCPHGWGYSSPSIAATQENDPRASETGFRCYHCGSFLSDDERAVLYPCEIEAAS